MVAGDYRLAQVQQILKDATAGPGAGAENARARRTAAGNFAADERVQPQQLFINDPDKGQNVKSAVQYHMLEKPALLNRHSFRNVLVHIQNHAGGAIADCRWGDKPPTCAEK